MGSPEVLDFAQLLAPITGENPAGPNLREDFSPDSIYHAVRDARAAAREAERRVVYEDEEDVPEASPADWRPILELAPKAIAEQSKDLELTALLIEALVREHGYAGLRDGFRLARELIEQFWDNLYPLPDEEDGVITRVGPLTGLNGEEGEGLLIAPISRVPVTEGTSHGPFTLSAYRQALELDATQDPDKRARRLALPGTVTKQMFDIAVRETSAEFFRNLLADISECSEEFKKLCEVLEEKCGKDESGYPLAPPSSAIRNALGECLEDMQAVTRHVLGGDGEEGEGSEMVPVGAQGAVSGQVQNREEAFNALLRAADFFKRTEPHSPVAYALEQAVRWGRMPLPELLSELIADETAREQLFKLVGIKPPEEAAE